MSNKIIPILFSTAMVQAILDGRKTQTRRVVKQAISFVSNTVPYATTGFIPAAKNIPAQDIDTAIKCPYGQPGDVLWVRESWQWDWLDYPERTERYYRFKADVLDGVNVLASGEKWKPSIHMPKEACRLWGLVKSIRVERLAEIGRLDCLAEGIYENVELEDTRHEKTYYQYEFGGTRYDSAYEAYKALWQKINGKPSPIQEKQNGKLRTIGYIVYPFDEACANEWAGKSTYKGKPLTVIANPWVWVIEFERCEMPAGFLTRKTAGR